MLEFSRSLVYVGLNIQSNSFLSVHCYLVDVRPKQIRLRDTSIDYIVFQFLAYFNGKKVGKKAGKKVRKKVKSHNRNGPRGILLERYFFKWRHREGGKPLPFLAKFCIQFYTEYPFTAGGHVVGATDNGNEVISKSFSTAAWRSNNDAAYLFYHQEMII